MVQQAFLVVYHRWEKDLPQLLFCPEERQAAGALGLTLCDDIYCADHRLLSPDQPRLWKHAHVPDAEKVFGQPQEYEGARASRDPLDSGLLYREWVTPDGEITIRWHYWARNSRPPAIYFVPARIVIPPRL